MNEMKFKGIQHPISEAQVGPSIAVLANSYIEYVKNHSVSQEDVQQMLEEILSFTKPNLGYYYYPIIDRKSLLTRYGKKILEAKNENSIE